MEELKNNKIFIFLVWLFIVISIIHIAYATYTHRGLYCDGGFYFFSMLGNFANGIHHFAFDTEHPRFCSLALVELPLMIVHKFFPTTSKSTLMSLFSFVQFAIPFLSLIWSYFLSKRTGKIDIFFWSLFFYGAVMLPYTIYSVVESLYGIIFHFILWNYLVSDIEYKKRDFVFVFFLLIMMFGTYEYVTYLGVVFFIAHFHYLFTNKNQSLKSQLLKIIIGWGSLAASIFDFVYMFHVPGEDGEVMRFLKEFVDFLPYVLHLNSLFSIIITIILFTFIFKITRIGIISVVLISLIQVIIFRYLYTHPDLSIYPMWEQHLRSVPCWTLPVVFIGMYIKDLFGTIDKVKFSNYICIALICAIAQTSWQLVESYYWNINVQYIKDELANTDDLLYIASAHENVISDFHNENLRRHIWHGTYALMSILLSETYKQKTLLVNYDTQYEDSNAPYRHRLFVIPEEQKISIPFGVVVDIKNQYWDLTDCAEALDKYNKEHNIKTDG